MVHNTLFVTPLWESLRDHGNFGRVFEQSFTQHIDALRESKSHHRAILYALGPLKVAVLCEVDASFTALQPAVSSRLKWTSEPLTPEEQALADATEVATAAQSALEQAMFAGVGAAGVEAFTLGGSMITRQGRGTPSVDVAEMTTRTDHAALRRNGLRDKLPQMWLGRTPVSHPSTSAFGIYMRPILALAHHAVVIAPHRKHPQEQQGHRHPHKPNRPATPAV